MILEIDAIQNWPTHIQRVNKRFPQAEAVLWSINKGIRQHQTSNTLSKGER